MMEIGEVLRHKREELGISLEKVEHITKIQKRYLRAIEVGDWKRLPEPVYTRGFIHSYARVVGVDPTTLSTTFLSEQVTDQNSVQNVSNESADVGKSGQTNSFAKRLSHFGRPSRSKG